MKNKFTKLLAVCLAVGAVIVIYFFANPPSDKEMVFSGTLENTSKHMGIIIRNEKKIETSFSGTVSAKVADGTLVPAGKLIASVINENADSSVQSELSAITKRIDEVEAAKKISDSFTDDIYKLDSKISEKTAELVYYADLGNMQSVLETKAAISALYEKKNKIGAGDSALSADLEELKKQKSSLEQILAEYEQNVYAPSPGIFVSSIDGYEDILSVGSVENLTYSDFKSISDKLRKKSDSGEDNQSGIKLIDNYMWCIAVSADKERSSDFEIGEEVFIRINGDKKNIKGKVAAISEEKGANHVITVSTTEYDANSYMQRSVEVELVKNIYSGLKVPVDAIVTKDGADGVYTASDNTVKFKNIEIIYKDEKYAIVKENNAAENSLLLYDEVLTSPKKAYEGKIVK